MLFFPTSQQSVGPRGELFFGNFPDEEYGIPIPPITMVDYEDTNKNELKDDDDKPFVLNVIALEDKNGECVY
eukprot:8797289-Ditylum_brightwellii.AAC.1